ncbi:MAG: undecaprenyl-diphosphate phosphatase, partial [Actinomycetota bacterium]|nr:undecaprenyl-diphosphate phosphatase [Actinomycetota bacterium]
RFNFFIALMAGIGQAIAILPGISRSGSTISFARFFGIKRSEAVRFSFLLSIPVIFGSFVFEIYRSSEIIFNGSLQIVGNLLVGFFFAFITGMLAIKFLVYLVKRKNLNIFAVYCVALSAVTFVFYIIKRFI